jgi:hypothetical protein
MRRDYRHSLKRLNVEHLNDGRTSVIGVDLKPYFLLALRHPDGQVRRSRGYRGGGKCETRADVRTMSRNIKGTISGVICIGLGCTLFDA